MLASWLQSKKHAEPVSAPPKVEAPASSSILVSGATQLTNSQMGFRTWAVSKFPFVIGRSTSKVKDELKPCDLLLDDHEPYTVSRNHCALVWVPSLGGFFVQDLGSKLGTIVNGLRIGRHTSKSTAALQKGDNDLAFGSIDSPYRLLIRVPLSGY